MKNKDFWKSVIQLAISVLTAALTAISTTSCMGHGPVYVERNIFRKRVREAWDTVLSICEDNAATMISVGIVL